MHSVADRLLELGEHDGAKTQRNDGCATVINDARSAASGVRKEWSTISAKATT